MQLTRVLASALLATTAAFAASIQIYNTGVQNDYSLAPAGQLDPHYTFVSGTLDPNPTPPFPVNGFPVSDPSVYVLSSPLYGYWLGPDPLSQWVGPDTGDGTSVAEVILDYRVSFDLTGFNLGTTKIQGQWSVDDWGLDILINHVSTGRTTVPTYYAGNWAPFTISSGFNPGINTLDFLWENGPAQSSLRVEFTSATDETPEPGSMGVVVLGLLGAGTMALRRRAKFSSAK